MIAHDLSQRSNASLTCFNVLEKFPAIMRDIVFPYAAMGSDEVEILNELRNGIAARGQRYIENTMGADASHVRLKVDFARDSMAKSKSCRQCPISSIAIRLRIMRDLRRASAKSRRLAFA